MAYKCGQEVFRESKPFSYIVFPKYRKIVCDWCLKMCESEGILKACVKCKWVHYCDQTCQKEAWKSHHKLECQYLQTQNMPKDIKECLFSDFQNYQELILKVLKTTLKLRRNEKEEFFQLPNGKKRCFADLVSNADEFRQQKEPRIQKVLHLIYAEFKIWLGDDAIQSLAEFFEICGKWNTNSTRMFAMNFDQSSIRIASGLYLGYSGLNHSCAPNAVWFNNGKELVVRTIEDVKNFSDLRISYFDARERTAERKNYLKRTYSFDCKCVRCEDPNSDAKYASLKCKSCPGWVHEKTMICSSCHQTLKLNDEEMIIVEKYRNGTLPKFEPTMTTKEIRLILEKLIKVFHVFHEIFTPLNKVFEFPKIVSKYQNGDHETMLLILEIRKLRLNHNYGHLPQYRQDFGFHHFKISCNCFELGLIDEAEFHLKKAEEIMKVAFGEEHPYVKECQKHKVERQIACLSLK